MSCRRKKFFSWKEKTTWKERKFYTSCRTDLQLPDVPLHIECFDNSNFQGSYPCRRWYVLKMACPVKRLPPFQCKTVEGINDFASMKEVFTGDIKDC
jgi:excinuclease ABC subunit C